ncbi:MAG: hypothetical protein HZB23_12260 [Deltaproteobacteria bacterium]|nr:hypothetical protein [Deltaproteobacteria bacterium]
MEEPKLWNAATGLLALILGVIKKAQSLPSPPLNQIPHNEQVAQQSQLAVLEKRVSSLESKEKGFETHRFNRLISKVTTLENKVESIEDELASLKDTVARLDQHTENTGNQTYKVV